MVLHGHLHHAKEKGHAERSLPTDQENGRGVREVEITLKIVLVTLVEPVLVIHVHNTEDSWHCRQEVESVPLQLGNRTVLVLHNEMNPRFATSVGIKVVARARTMSLFLA